MNLNEDHWTVVRCHCGSEEITEKAGVSGTKVREGAAFGKFMASTAGALRGGYRDRLIVAGVLIGGIGGWVVGAFGAGAWT